MAFGAQEAPEDRVLGTTVPYTANSCLCIFPSVRPGHQKEGTWEQEANQGFPFTRMNSLGQGTDHLGLNRAKKSHLLKEKWPRGATASDQPASDGRRTLRSGESQCNETPVPQRVGGPLTYTSPCLLLLAAFQGGIIIFLQQNRKLGPSERKLTKEARKEGQG